MALNITTPVNTSIGVTILTSYARVSVVDLYAGTSLQTSIQIYADKTVYESGADPLPVVLNGRFMQTTIQFPYNRELDGADILGLAHTAWIAQLSDWGIIAVENLSLSL